MYVLKYLGLSFIYVVIIALVTWGLEYIYPNLTLEQIILYLLVGMVAGLTASEALR